VPVLTQLHGLLALAETNEVGGHHSALVDQLVEAVLPVRAGLAKVYFACLKWHHFAVHGDALSVGFHVHLLDVRRKAQECLRVRQQSARAVPQER
jgi:hypothetical protein